MKNHRKTHCGTLDYTPPEMLIRQQTGHDNAYDFGVDVWSVGIFAYELTFGSPPFESQNQKSTQQKIWNMEFRMPDLFSPDLKDFLRQVLVRNPSQRISLQQMLQHRWITKHHRDSRDKSKGKTNTSEVV